MVLHFSIFDEWIALIFEYYSKSIFHFLVFDSNDKFDEQLWDKVYKVQSTDPESHFNVVKQLIKLRETPSVTYGTFNSTVLNETVFAFTR